MLRRLPHSPFFFFNDTATTEIYTLSLHDALPIYRAWLPKAVRADHALDVSARHRGGVAHGLVVQKDAAQRPASHAHHGVSALQTSGGSRRSWAYLGPGQTIHWRGRHGHSRHQPSPLDLGYRPQ